jgi:hypothetical protein
MIIDFYRNRENNTCYHYILNVSEKETTSSLVILTLMNCIGEEIKNCIDLGLTECVDYKKIGRMLRYNGLSLNNIHMYSCEYEQLRIMMEKYIPHTDISVDLSALTYMHYNEE